MSLVGGLNTCRNMCGLAKEQVSAFSLFPLRPKRFALNGMDQRKLRYQGLDARAC
jgi:hypothetical protein